MFIKAKFIYMITLYGPTIPNTGSLTFRVNLAADSGGTAGGAVVGTDIFKYALASAATVLIYDIPVTNVRNGFTTLIANTASGSNYEPVFGTTLVATETNNWLQVTTGGATATEGTINLVLFVV